MRASRGPARFGAAAVLLGASVLLSRVLGFVREAVLAYQVGAGAATDAYRAAFQIPDLLNHFLAGGALSIAFMPLYTAARARGGKPAAERLFATVLGTLGLAAALATAGLWWQAGPLVALQFPRFEPEVQALTVRLTRIVLPAQIFFVTGGILRAVSMAEGSFGSQAAAPLVYNLGIILGGLLLGPRLGVEGFAWGALAGGVAGGFLISLPEAARRVSIRVRIAPLDPAFRRYLVLAGPLTFGATLLTVDEWYGRWFGALLPAGTVAYLGYARQLVLIPVGVVGQAVAAAALPTFAALFAENRRAELDRLVLRTLQAAGALAVLAGAAAFAFAGPGVRLVYQRGAFSPADSDAVTALLALFAFGVPAWVIQQIAVRSFYARGDTWRPMLLGTAVNLAVVPLYLLLGRRHGGAGLAAAGAIGMSVNAGATLALARILHRAPELRALSGSLLRALAVAVPAALAGRWLQTGGPGALGALLDLATGGAVFAAVTLLGVRLAGDAPLQEALGSGWAKLSRRLRRA